MKHHLLGPLASLAIIISGSNVLATPPTPLYPRSGPSSGIYNGSTTQTLQSSPGTSQAAAVFTTTNAALDFYSAALTNPLALASTESSDGTIYVANTGGAAFTLNSSVDFYDYNPATGSSTLIVAGKVASGQLINASQTKSIGLQNSANIGGPGYTVVVGHMLKATIKLAVTSGGTPSGALLFNTLHGQGATFLYRLPQNRILDWPFGSFSTGVNATITAPAAVCANSSNNIASVPANAGATYAWSITNGTITAGQGTPQITWTAGDSGPLNLGVTVANGSAASGAVTVAVMGNTSTAIISSANPSVAGQTVSFNASVSPVAPGFGTPSGTVQFQTNGVNLGAPVTLAGGSAISPAIALMTTGNYAVSAIYSGDASFCASSGSLAGGQEVDKAASATAISSSLNPSLPGASVSFMATVSMLSACVPAGQVQFIVDGAPLGSPVPLIGGTASLTTLTLPPGSHVVSAVYSGDSICLGSANSLSPDQLVDAAPVAGNDVLETFENSSVTVTAASLLANDTDDDGDSLSLSSVSTTSAQGGTVSLGGGSVTYTPPTNYAGADSFTYTVSDTFGATATGTVNVTVHGNNGTSLAINMLADHSQQLNCTGAVPGRPYLLQATFDLMAGSWTTLSTNFADLEGAFLFIDTDAVNHPARFYRTATP